VYFRASFKDEDASRDFQLISAKLKSPSKAKLLKELFKEVMKSRYF